MLINGQVSDVIAADDRGLQFGDGIFETMTWENGGILHWRHHTKRIEKSLKALLIEPVKRQLLKQEIAQAVSESGLNKAVVKCILTRGRGGRGYGAVIDGTPQRVISVHPFPDLSAHREGIAIGVSKVQIAHQPMLAGMKHLSRLEYVMAKQDCLQQGYFECVLCDVQQQVVEATTSNVFAIKGRTLVTPAIEQAGVAGVAREVLIGVANRLNYKVDVVKNLAFSSLGEYDELFLSNAVMGYVPVARCGDIEFSSVQKGQYFYDLWHNHSI